MRESGYTKSMRREIHTGFWYENTQDGGDNLKVVCVGGSLILNYISVKYSRTVKGTFMSPRIGHFGYHAQREIS